MAPAAAQLAAKRYAAVAATLRPRPDGDIEALFIQRAASPQDPWSGQMAFPGGRYEISDQTLRQTAERETQEEIGLDLGPARLLGSLTELEGGRATNRLISVTAFVYWYPFSTPALEPNYEVADTVWVPLSELVDPQRHIEYHYPVADAYFPGIQLDRPHQVIWGLTLRMLADLFHHLGQPFIELDPLS